MKKSRRTEKTLVASAIALILCFTMLLGTTFAWFTSTVQTDLNIIKTGKLVVSLEHSDYSARPTGADDSKWLNAERGKLFNYDRWEPGYVDVQYVKIQNEGTLDFKFMLTIVPDQAAGAINLADQIEVYMVSGAVGVTRDQLTPSNTQAYRGTLTELMADTDGAAYGTLYAGTNADPNSGKNNYEIYTIALKMKTDAGNDYQDKTVGGGFYLKLFATQLESENDDLGTDYDKDATYDRQ